MENNKNNICPIPATHKRLNDAYFCLNEAIKTYQEPNKFLANINNLIQSLRNITFILQSEKHKINNFDNWYGEWQEKMRNDDVLKWLVSARNTIVKQGDLETKSIATVYVKTYEKKKILQLSFDPFSKLDDIVDNIIKHNLINIPKELKNDIVFVFERRWSVIEFPNADIVDLLIYCTDSLIRLIMDAHDTLNKDLLTCEHNSFSLDEILKFLFKMHNKVEKNRTINITSSYSKITTKITSIAGKINKEILKSNKIIKKIDKILSEKEAIEDEYPFSEINHQLGLVKYLLEKDKYLMSVAFVYTNKDEPPIMVSTQLSEQIDKYMFAEQIAKFVEENNAIGVLTINESWYISPEEYKKYNKRPSENPAKKEAIMISIATPSKTKTYTIPFSRTVLGNIHLGDLEITDGELPFFDGVYDIWKERKVSAL